MPWRLAGAPPARDALMRRLTRRLVETDADHVELVRLESEILELWKRLYYFAKRAAKIVLDEEQPIEDSGSSVL